MRRRLRLVAQRVAPADSNRAKCGRVLCTERVETERGWRDLEVGVVVKGVPGRWAHFAGLVTCGSAWACPVCSAKIAHVRAGEVRRALASCRTSGGAAYMMTLTTPHDVGDALKPMLRAVHESWSYVLQGRGWVELKETLGLIGFIRGSDEPTVGPKGWHPHLHVVLLFARPLTQQEQNRLKAYVYERWCKSIVRHGYRRPSQDAGVHLTESHEDTYITKLGLADEITGGVYKRAKDGRRTPLQLLIEAERGDRGALELFREYAKAMRGRKRLTWSSEEVVRGDGTSTRRTLRARYAAEAEASDAHAAASDDSEPAPDPDARFLVPVDRRLWASALAENAEAQSELLAFGRKFGEMGVLVYLRWVKVLATAATRTRQPPMDLWRRVHDPPQPARLAA